MDLLDKDGLPSCGQRDDSQGSTPDETVQPRNGERQDRCAPPPAFLDDLDASLQMAWALLEQGVADRRAAARTVTLATSTAAGTPAVRTLVLRGCDAQQRVLLLHTDRRSPKFIELLQAPRCSLLVYDREQKIQLRMEALTSLHTDDSLADAQWAATRPLSRRGYGIASAPGLPIAQPAAAGVALDDVPAIEQRAHFAVIRAQIVGLEWLYLSAGGHRRAQFRFSPNLQARWLVP